MESLLFKFYQSGCGYRLYLGNDVVGTLKLYDFAQFCAIEHIEHMAAVSHLHSRCAGIFVASHHFHAKAHQLNCDFLAQLSTSQ